MDRKSLVGGIVLVITIISIPILWSIYSPYGDNPNGDVHELVWAVEVGDEFEYSIIHYVSS